MAKKQTTTLHPAALDDQIFSADFSQDADATAFSPQRQVAALDLGARSSAVAHEASSASQSYGRAVATENPTTKAADPSTYAPTGGAFPSPETVTLAGSGLVFINTYDHTATSDVSEAYHTAILYAEHELQSHFTNSVTIRVNYGFANLSGFLAQNSFFNTVQPSYATLKNALTSHATSADDIAAVNALPASAPSNAHSSSATTGFLVASGMARILGLAGPSSNLDDSLVLGNGFTWNFDPNNRAAAGGYDAIGAIEHEITEGGMGRVGGLGFQNNTWAPMDLFRFNAAGQRNYTGGQDGVNTYFSPNGSNPDTTHPYHKSVNAAGQFDGQDPADWDVGGDAFGFGSPGVPGLLSETDLRVMDVIGWTRGTTDDFPANSTTSGVVAVGGSATGNLEVVADHDWFRVQVTAGTSYTIDLQGDTVGAGTLHDPFMSLFGPASQLITSDDDGGGNLNARISFTPSASGTYFIDAGAFDNAGTGTYRVSVTTLNRPPVITSDGGGDTAAKSVPENSTAVTTVTATDPDANTVSYSIVGGADAAKFQITSGVLSFITAPNFEVPSDSDANNSFIVQVRATDNGTPSLSDNQTITVNLTNVNEFAPVITSDGGGDTVTKSIFENSGAVTTVHATDNDGTLPTYSIIGGADAAKFQINGTSGALSFITPPNFEIPTDSDHNNSYIVQVRAADSSLFDNQTITVNVTDVSEFIYVGGWTGSGNDPQGWYIGDFNGDNRDDILRYHGGVSGAEVFTSTGSSFTGGSSWTGSGNDPQGWYVGDFSGDGKDDILRYHAGVSGAEVFTSTGSSFTGGSSWTGSGNDSQGWYVGDFNGDGKDDILRYHGGVSGAEVFTSTGSSFVGGSSWTGAGNDGKWYVGDFNGDGNSDIFRITPGVSGAEVFLSNGSAFVFAGSWTGAGVDDQGWYVGDFNKDGKDDILRHNAGVSGGEVFLSNGAAFVFAGSWTGAGNEPQGWYVGDFNGGGAADIFRYSPGFAGADMFLSPFI